MQGKSYTEKNYEILNGRSDMPNHFVHLVHQDMFH